MPCPKDLLRSRGLEPTLPGALCLRTFALKPTYSPSRDRAVAVRLRFKAHCWPTQPADSRGFYPERFLKRGEGAGAVTLHKLSRGPSTRIWIRVSLMDIERDVQTAVRFSAFVVFVLRRKAADKSCCSQWV